MQIVSLLNDEFSGTDGAQMARGVLATLAVLLARNDSARKRLAHDVSSPTKTPARLRIASIRNGCCS